MLRRQGRNRPQSAKIDDPLSHEGLDALPLFGRKLVIGERRDNLLQLAFLRADLLAEFRKSRQRGGESLPYDSQQSLRLNDHSQTEQIVDASLVGIGQQGFRLRR